jgi:excisionase family DNA binding protein
MSYLNTEEAAAYLGIRERKLYELVAQGAVPCSKVTGRWLFPRAALDRWIESGLVQPAGVVAPSPPPIIGGSHDPLLDWAARHSGSGLALLSEGSEAGLERLARGEVAIAALHLHAASPPDPGDPSADANVAAVMARESLRDTVLLAFARREQGLLTAAGNPLRLRGLSDVVANRARIGLRQPGAGASQLLACLLREARHTPADLAAAPDLHATGQDLAFALRSGRIDCGLATRAVADAAGLGFVPLVWERFDLALRRRTFFEPGPQRLFGLMRAQGFAAHAATLTGYDLSETGNVRLNR